jgi:hypothetical protein
LPEAKNRRKEKSRGKSKLVKRNEFFGLEEVSLSRLDDSDEGLDAVLFDSFVPVFQLDDLLHGLFACQEGKEGKKENNRGASVKRCGSTKPESGREKRYGVEKKERVE